MGGGERKEGKGRVEQVWNKKRTQQGRNEVSTENKFGALAVEGEYEEDIQEIQPTKTKDIGTKKWVEDTFGGNAGKSGTDSKEDEQTNPVETDQNLKPMDSQTVNKKGGNEDARISNKVGDLTQGGGSKEEECNSVIKMKEKEDDNKKNYPDLQELTDEEKQQRRDTGEDEDMGENIQNIVREGDLSPRQIQQLESGAK